MENNNYIASLFKPQTKSQGRKVWSIDLETVWLPFFTATNTLKVTDIERDALGAPLRLAYNPDGSVKFNEKSGKPVIRVAKPIADSVRLVRENFVAGLQSYTHEVVTSHEQDYNNMVKACLKAGKPILKNDKEKLENAMTAIQQATIADIEENIKADNKADTAKSNPKELVTA